MAELRPGGDLAIPIHVSDDTIVQNPTTNVFVGNLEIKPTDILVKTNRYSQASVAEVTGLADERPPQGDTLTVDINGLRVFTGRLYTSAPQDDEGGFKLTAYDAVKDLMRVSFNKSYSKINPKEIAKDVADQADVEIRIVDDIGTFAPSDADRSDPNVGPDLLDLRYFIRPEIFFIPGESNPDVSAIDYNGKSGTQVLDHVVKMVDGIVWRVNEENILVLGHPDPTYYWAFSEFIQENPTAGSEELPYERVVVYGESPASEKGYGVSHMIRKQPIVGEAGDGEPVFEYTSPQVKTKRQAEIAARAIYEEFMRQRGSGVITLVGAGAQLRPFDVISTPKRAGLGDDQYLASRIKHTFNNEDGLLTDISVGGVVRDL